MNLAITISAATLAPARVPPAEAGLPVANRVLDQISAAAPIWPVSAPANAEAIVKEHRMPKSPDKAVDPAALTEVDGLQLDLIPFVGDGAILTDDLPQEDPEAIVQAPADAPHSPEHRPTTTTTHSDDPSTGSDRALHETAERTYLADRPITGVPISVVSMTDTAAPAQPDDTPQNPVVERPVDAILGQ